MVKDKTALLVPILQDLSDFRDIIFVEVLTPEDNDRGVNDSTILDTARGLRCSHQAEPTWFVSSKDCVTGGAVTPGARP